MTEPSAAAAPSKRSSPDPSPAPSSDKAGPQPTAAQAGADSAPCDQICARTTELGCKLTAQCAELCPEAMESDGCSEEMRAVTDCIVKEPVAHWECAEPGLAAIKSGFCDAQQEAFVHCMMR